MIEDYSPNVTFEGDNTVMAQQSCKFLLKMQKKISENPGSQFDPCFNYIKEANTVTKKKCRAKLMEDFLNLDVIEEALKVRILVKLNYIVKKRDESTLSKNEFMNSVYAEDIVRLSEEHIKFITFQFFKWNVTSSKIKCSNLKKTLTDLCMLNGLDLLHKDSRACYECGYFGSEPYGAWILDAIKHLNQEIRPQALNILESFNMNDNFLMSAIGNSYGDIYETHLRWAQNSRYNKTKAGDSIPDGYLEYMTPILKAKL